ncbi:MAG: cpaB [Devosia sp.]|uniref:Flp pilus assembly protein CpaB n=1 Tax=Devosia sp. TaxID=1871048 RepID=UPI00262BF48C|nr:Flp pilus assembly protein CpaB [Devosia sp.]MDB5528303.1 cpaB [Devosia sp.]
MKPARIILLLVAIVAGGLAAFLVTRGGGTPTTQIVTNEVIQQEAKTQILVAKGQIGMGERLTAATVAWQDWPEGAIRPEYVTITAMPDAPSILTGAVARFEFFPGEPIREQKLVRSEQGYLSAVLSKGMRGVSVPVDASSSAGGYIVPNDHVDVLLSHASDQGQVSELVLSNVRVLAIGNRLGEVGASGGAADANAEAGPQAQVFVDNSIATLELTPGQAETLVNAVSRGTLSLSLRSITDFGDTAVASRDATTTSVRLIRFGQEQSVMSGVSRQPEGGQPAAVAPPATYAPPAQPRVILPSPAQPQVTVQ